MNKVLCLIVCFLVLGVGSGWGEDLTVTGDIQMNKSLRMSNDVRTWVLHSDNSPDEFRLMSNGTNLNPVLTIKPNGKVGIGSTDPFNLLTLEDPNGETSLRFNDIQYGLLGVMGSAKAMIAGTFTSEFGIKIPKSFVIATGGTAERFRINESGNVGIGTTNPQSKLHVNGQILFNDSTSNTKYGVGRFDFNSATNQPLAVTGLFANASYPYAAVSLGFDNNGVANPKLTVRNNGCVGIGTTDPGSYMLAVAGTIHAKEVVVDTNWADYVFKPDYTLKPLSEVEAYIKENNHLPDVPSEKEVKENGLNMSEMMSTQMKKIEELTLHLINQSKLISEQNNQMLEMKKTLTDENNQLKAEVDLLKQKMVK